MSTIKVGLLWTAALCNHISFTSPQPPPTSQELLKKQELSAIERAFGKVVILMTSTTKYLGWAGAICESAVILAHDYPEHPLSQYILNTFVWGPVHSASSIRIAPVFLAGCGIAALSAFVRVQCYRALGRFFTFELALKRDHQLVTIGPYSVVRHPSYTALLLSVAALTLCHSSEGSWVRESGVLGSPYGKVLAYGWLAMTSYSSFSIIGRTVQEDTMLKKQFGEQWSAWAAMVPYRLIPGIF